MQIRLLSFRPMTSINLSYDIIGSITKCHNDSFDLKLVYSCNFNDFLSFFNVFLKIHAYIN